MYICICIRFFKTYMFDLFELLRNERLRGIFVVELESAWNVSFGIYVTLKYRRKVFC